MKNDFTPGNPHEENVKISVDKILGAETTFKKTKRNAEDHKRIVFCRIITNLIKVEERALIMDESHNLNFTHYDRPFFDIIEDMFSLQFSKQQIGLINFFLYDRYVADGSVLTLTNDETNEVLQLDSPEQLWEVIKKIK
jgi:hypothetical protein